MERAEIWPHLTLGGSLAGRLSATMTSMPRQARSRASVMPTGPPPTISTLVSARISHTPCGLRCSFGEADTAGGGESVSGHTVEPPNAGDARRKSSAGRIECEKRGLAASPGIVATQLPQVLLGALGCHAQMIVHPLESMALRQLGKLSGVAADEGDD